jgi:hypothetical protein
MSSVRFQFDGQLDDELELPLSFHRHSGEWDVSSVAFLKPSNHPDDQKDLSFKVKIVLPSSIHRRFSLFALITTREKF